MSVFDGFDTYHGLTVVMSSRNYNQIINFVVVRVRQIGVSLPTFCKLNLTENQVRCSTLEKMGIYSFRFFSQRELEWVRKMNNIRQQAEETVFHDLIDT